MKLVTKITLLTVLMAPASLAAMSAKILPLLKRPTKPNSTQTVVYPNSAALSPVPLTTTAARNHITTLSVCIPVCITTSWLAEYYFKAAVLCKTNPKQRLKYTLAHIACALSAVGSCFSALWFATRA